MLATGFGALHSWHSRNLYVEAAFLSEAYDLTSAVKLRVSDYYLKNGTLPNDNADAGLPPAKSIFGTSVKRIALSRSGVIIVDFEESIGEKAMTFIPTVSDFNGLLNWRCTSDSIDRAVLELLKPSCSFLPASQERRLMYAIANRDLPKVEIALKAGAEPNALVNGNTPLMLAAKIGDIDIVNRLLAVGAEVDNGAINAERRTPLMVAITSNNSEVVSLLLSHGASISRKDHRGLSAMDHAMATDRRLGGERYVLMIAARLNPKFAGSPAAMPIGLMSPEESEERLRNLYSEYRWAITSCHVQRLQSLLNAENELQSPELINGMAISQHIRKPDCVAVLDGHLKSKGSYQAALNAYIARQVQECQVPEVESTMRDNPELSVMDLYQGRSYLKQAVSAGCTAVVRMMVRGGNLPDGLPDDILATAIQQAPQSSLISLVGSLIAIGANVDGRDARGQTPLALAIALEQPVIAKYLVDAGADVNSRTQNRSFPLIEASKKGYEHLALHMIAGGAKLDAIDAMGRTSLMAAVSRDNQRLVDSLIRAGANIRLKDSNGIDAVLLAETRNLRQIKRLLIASQ